MKAQCEMCGGKGFIVVPCNDDTAEQRPCEKCQMDGWVDVPTADLIAELERRRPCKKCKHLVSIDKQCQGCMWLFADEMGNKTDNFKEAK